LAPGSRLADGTILARVANTSRLMARIHVPEAQAGNADVNQPAAITLQDRSYAARVVHVDPNVQNGTVSIDLKFTGPQPREARTDLSASGAIEVEKIPSTTYVKWPLQTRAGAPLSLFKLLSDGKEARRVDVVLGLISTDSVQVKQGLRPGDQIIVSDMSDWRRYPSLQLK
jgi:hypothetical protein